MLGDRCPNAECQTKFAMSAPPSPTDSQMEAAAEAAEAEQAAAAKTLHDAAEAAAAEGGAYAAQPSMSPPHSEVGSVDLAEEAAAASEDEGEEMIASEEPATGGAASEVHSEVHGEVHSEVHGEVHGEVHSHCTATDVLEELPEHDSLYYDYLVKCPVGASMFMYLRDERNDIHKPPPNNTMGDFVIVKGADHQWSNGRGGRSFHSLELLRFVRAQMPGETHIRVSHGKDPVMVKREYIERGEEEEEVVPTTYSLAVSIDLTDDHHDVEGQGEAAAAGAFSITRRRSFCNVVLSLAYPPNADVHDEGGDEGGKEGEGHVYWPETHR